MNDRSMPSGSEPVKNIVLVGRAGNGKSATGNSLIRKKLFTSLSQATGVTMTCQTFRAAIEDRRQIINVIDTPGLFDLITKPDIISKEIVRCLALAEEGLHAVVLVLSARARITQEEENTLCTLQILFGGRIVDYLIVVFTGGDELDSNNQTLDMYLNQCPPFLEQIFRLCGHRKVLFYNRTDDQVKKDTQIKQLLDYVAEIERNNGGRPFTEEMHRQMKEANDRHRREEEEAAANYLAEELEKEKMRLREAHDRTMREMERMMNNTVNEAWRAHQIFMRVMETRGPGREQVPDPVRCNIM